MAVILIAYRLIGTARKLKSLGKIGRWPNEVGGAKVVLRIGRVSRIGRNGASNIVGIRKGQTDWKSLPARDDVEDHSEHNR